MGQAKWIWFPGDFELYHNIQLHTRREGEGFTSPAYWDMAAPYPVGDFYRTITADKDFTMKVVSDAKGCGHLDGRHFPLNEEIRVPAGTHEFRILLIDGAAFPAFFIDSPYLITDENWQVTHGTSNRWPAACEPAYTRPEDRPTAFPFSYERMDPVHMEKVDGGLLYDFGKELFGLVCIEGADPEERFLVNYGESREEALDRKDANVKEVVSGKSAYRLVPRGFRYLFLDTPKAEGYTIWADYEYLPLEDIGSFRCSDPMVEKIYETCAYTFHLNSREFYLDGIKRDRWVWSGDAYQSYKINNYLYFDPGITRRTLIALLGKPAYESHINFINDYTLYLLIALYEFYETTGDKAFLEFIYPRAKALYDFAVGRLDDDGLVCQREGDWIFIDWSDMDKSGPPLCRTDSFVADPPHHGEDGRVDWTGRRPLLGGGRQTAANHYGEILGRGPQRLYRHLYLGEKPGDPPRQHLRHSLRLRAGRGAAAHPEKGIAEPGRQPDHHPLFQVLRAGGPVQVRRAGRDAGDAGILLGRDAAPGRHHHLGAVRPQGIGYGASGYVRQQVRPVPLPCLGQRPHLPAGAVLPGRSAHGCGLPHLYGGAEIGPVYRNGGHRTPLRRQGGRPVEGWEGDRAFHQGGRHPARRREGLSPPRRRSRDGGGIAFSPPQGLNIGFSIRMRVV